MGKTVRSARGSAVDFDLIKIKEQMASLPTNSEVRARQNFIEKKLRRRLKKATMEKVATTSAVSVEPILPGTEKQEEPVEEVEQEEPSVAQVSLDPVESKPAEKRTTRQKARAKT